MYAKQLESIGLSPNAARIYEILLEHGPLPASRIARLSGVERSLSYVVLGELVAAKLATKDEKPKVAKFVPAAPQKLESLVAERRHEAETAAASFDAVIHQLQQQYETQSGQPGVRFYDGAAGIKYINKQVRNQDIAEMLLIRSDHSSADVEAYQELIHAQRDLRIKKGIPLKVIAPSIASMKVKLQEDEKSLTERRIIAKEMFATPAQILIFSNTVAITTYTKPNLTTIIEHEAISITLKTLFMYIWRSSRAETEQYIKKFAAAK